MIEMENRVREAFARAVESVVPEPNPMARLLARRRRTRRRVVVSLAAVLAAALAGGVLAPVGGPGPSPEPEPVPVPDEWPRLAGWPIALEWTRRLIDSPTRGNAADPAYVAAVTRELDRYRGELSISPTLDRIKVLAVVDSGGMRTAFAAFYSDTHAALVTRSAREGASAGALVGGEFGGSASNQLDPFVLEPMNASGPDGEFAYTVALVPAGCRLFSSDSAELLADGSIRRNWRDHGDNVVRPGAYKRSWWKVDCAGVTRYLRPGPSLGSGPQPDVQTSVPPLRGSADPAHVHQALDIWARETAYLDAGSRQVLWGGVPPGESRPTVVLTGRTPRGGVVVLALTGRAEAASVAAAVPDGQLARTIAPGNPQKWAVATTATGATSDGLVAVRLPAEGDAPLLGERILVIAPTAATRVGIDGGGAADYAPVPLTDGVGVLTLPLPADVTLRALGESGAVLAETKIAEPRADGMLFGEGLVLRW